MREQKNKKLKTRKRRPPKNKKIGKKRLLTQKLERKESEIEKKFIKTFLKN